MAVTMLLTDGVYWETGIKAIEALMPVKSGFIVKGDSRRIVPVKINGKQYIVVTVNNGELHLFQLNK